jgi:hypothetical protein
MEHEIYLPEPDIIQLSNKDIHKLLTKRFYSRVFYLVEKGLVEQ